MSPFDAPVTKHRPRKLVLAVWASIALAILVIALGYIFLPKGLMHVQRFEPYQGTLLLLANTQWEAPSGEKVQGLISYDPSSKSVSYAIPPFSTYSLFSINSSSLFQDRLLTVRNEDSSIDLVIVDLKTQEAEEIDSISADAGIFGQSFWSSDGTRIAYVIYPLEGTPSLRVTGDGVADLGFGIPLTFSPTAEEVLIDTRPMLTTINIESGERVEFAGVAFSSYQEESVYAAPTGNYVIALLSGDRFARVYQMDWNSHAAVMRGVIPIKEGSSMVFNTNDQVLITSDGLSKAYQLSESGTHTTIGVYDFELPADVRIISWNSL